VIPIVGVHSGPSADAKAPGFPTGRALVVAVANYTEVEPLPNAVLSDARDFAALLRSPDACGYDVNHVNVLLDGEATLTGIRTALANLAADGEPDDTVVIYFSGHGALIDGPMDRSAALIPVDCSRADILGTSLSEAELSRAFSAMNVRRLVVLLDACHAGGAGNLKSNGDNNDIALGFSDKALGKLAQGSGRVLIASSRMDEYSLVLPGARNSLFTEHLLAALGGAAPSHGDGVIRIFETFSYVSAKVRHAAPGRQHPIFKAHDVEDNFPIALYRGGAKSEHPVEPSTAQASIWDALLEILTELYPTGPLEQEIWGRAGGDVSMLKLGATGRASWYAALRTLRQGGGGTLISPATLISTVLTEFPHHPQLSALTP
jgi:hypothetical protein